MMKAKIFDILIAMVVLAVFAGAVGLGALEEKKETEATKIPPVTVVEKVESPFKTDMDKVSYAIGQQMATNLKARGIEINVQLLAQGIEDALAGKEPAISKAEQQKVIMEFEQKIRAKMQEREKMEAIKNMSKEAAWKLQLKKPELMKFDSAKEYFWILETNKGTIQIKLMPDIAPMHVTSTIFLTRKGFYDNLTFHRVIPGFMAQGGCPLGTGRGGPGYQYSGEINPKVKHDRPYLLSMANAGPNTDGSQFFLTFKATPWLDGKHTIFGEIVAGQDVMKKLEASGTATGNPTEKLIITKAIIEEKDK